MRVNLIEEKKTKVSFDFLKVVLIILIIVILTAAVLFQINLLLEKKLYSEEINRLNKQLGLYLAKEEKYREVNAKIKTLKNLPSVPKYKWDGPIEALGYITPLGGVIENFSLEKEKFNIRGTTTAPEELRELSLAIAELPFLKNIELKSLEKEKEIKFSITAHLVEAEVD